MYTMKTMTARDAKTHFGEFLDTVQREPVIITKNNRPVGITLSITDAADSLIPELFMPKEAGYDEWFKAKVENALSAINDGKTSTKPHDQVFSDMWAKLRAKHPTKFA
jgi:prevent-host-death family protein